MKCRFKEGEVVTHKGKNCLVLLDSGGPVVVLAGPYCTIHAERASIEPVRASGVRADATAEPNRASHEF